MYLITGLAKSRTAQNIAIPVPKALSEGYWGPILFYSSNNLPVCFDFRSLGGGVLTRGGNARILVMSGGSYIIRPCGMKIQ